MPKESVIVFEGEDKFIVKKNREYNKATGKSYYVGAEGEAQQDSQTQNTLSSSPEANVFNQYMANLNTSVVIPISTDTDFCEKAQLFLSTNGDGKATAEQVMQVYNDFRSTCLKSDETYLTHSEWHALSCDDIDAKLKSLNDFLQVSRLTTEIRDRYQNSIELGTRVKAEKCGITPPKLADTPISTTTTTNVNLSNLGVPPKSSSSQSDGGEKKEEKKPNYLLWVLLLGGLVLLMSSDKK